MKALPGAGPSPLRNNFPHRFSSVSNQMNNYNEVKEATQHAGMRLGFNQYGSAEERKFLRDEPVQERVYNSSNLMAG